MSQEALPYLGTKPHVIALAELEVTQMRGCGGFDWPEFYNFLCHPKAANFTFLVPEPHTGKPGEKTVHDNMWYFKAPRASHINAIAVPWFGHVHTTSVHCCQRSEVRDQAVTQGVDRVREPYTSPECCILYQCS